VTRDLQAMNAATAAAMTERVLQTQVERLARLLGWMAYHTEFSIRSTAGFPDLVLVHPVHGLVFLELKSERGRTTPAQEEWLEALAVAGVYARVIRPTDLISGVVEQILKGGQP
jgi:hypothetical protein